MNSLCIRQLLILLFIFIVPKDVFAHARLRSDGTLSPRSNNSGLKTGPCGGIPRTSPRVLQAGSTITVTWEEVIQHPGRYEFYFSESNETNFQLLKTVPDNQDSSADLPHQYSTTIQLPNRACTNCTIQMIQVMTEDPLNPRNYYSCADIQLTSSGTTPPNSSPVPTPSPAPPTQGGQECH